MIKRLISGLTLQTKATVIALGVIAITLTITTLATVVQTNSLITTDQRRTVDSMAQSLAWASELAVAVRDKTELSRLSKGFLRDPNILFIEIYDEFGNLLTTSVQDEIAWKKYRQSGKDDDLFLLGQMSVWLDRSSDGTMGDGVDEDAAVIESMETEFAEETGKTGKKMPRQLVGRVVLAISTEPMLVCQRDHTRMTLSVAIPAAIASAMIIFLGVKHWASRLKVLVEGSERISRGDLTWQIKNTSTDEIGRLSRAYEHMRKAVQQRDGKLRQFNDTLHQQVKERTGELANAKDALEEANATLEQRVTERTSELVAANDQIRQAQVELVQAEKMSMLGQLVAGVAHEINTPTGAILNVMTDAHDHLQNLLASSIHMRELSPDIAEWLSNVCVSIHKAPRNRSEASNRSLRRQVEKEIRGEGFSNYRRLAGVITNCFGDDWRAEPHLLEYLAEGSVLGVLEHTLSLSICAEISLASAKKIARIVRALRYYSHSGKDSEMDIDVNEDIDNTLVIFQNRIKHIAEATTVFGEDIPPVRCSPNLSQIWTNILNNACDAIEESGRKGDGAINIRTERVGDRVVVKISNNGTPIPEEIIQKIYDPFFTTKPMGKGTGLGLGICTGILRHYGGTISARNEPGWVIFEVSLPLALSVEQNAQTVVDCPVSQELETSSVAEGSQ